MPVTVERAKRIVALNATVIELRETLRCIDQWGIVSAELKVILREPYEAGERQRKKTFELSRSSADEVSKASLALVRRQYQLALDRALRELHQLDAEIPAEAVSE